MQLKTLTAITVAAAFAIPFAAQASVDTDNIVVAQAGGGGAGGAGAPGGAAGTGDTGGRPDSAAGASAGSLFDRLDKNKDGHLTRDEAEAETRLTGRFVELDKDNDGKLSRSELQALEPEKSGAGTGGTTTPEKKR